ncbi:MAG: phosphomannose isomerase type II C-terminal cupin domain [Nocardioidaceae bacterium]
MLAEREERPWGSFEVVDEGAGFCVKRICVLPGQRLSYQRHACRTEHWYVVAGAGVATLDGVEHGLKLRSVLDIPVGTAHRVANSADDDLVFIEVQSGTYLGEDDIERLDDDYGRMPA